MPVAQFLKKCLLVIALAPLAMQAQTHVAPDSLLPDTMPRESVESLAPGRKLQAHMQALLAEPFLQKSQASIVIFDLTADSLLFAHQAAQRVRPASCIKLLTAITALDRLGATYPFRTSLCTDADSLCQTDSVLHGNLIVRGGFDPLLGAKELQDFTSHLKACGIKRIAGKLLLDCAMKDDRMQGASWCWDDDCDTNPVLTPLSYQGRDSFFTAFQSALQAAGICFEGVACDEKNHRLLLTETSHSLQEVMHPMLKDSDNFCAEAVFYNLAATLRPQGATAKEGAQTIAQLTRNLGFDPSDYSFADGSGVSLYNYVSAELLVAFLRHAYRQPPIYESLTQALPVAGTDGTLRNRLKGASTKGCIFAKTGSATSVSSLSGYALHPNGHTIAFAILNTGQKRAADARYFQDRICRIIME